MSVDWSAPLIGEPTPKGIREGFSQIAIEIDPTYHRAPDKIPVRFARNLFTGRDPKGTWLFDRSGESLGGKNQFGEQDAIWSVRNAPPSR